MSVPDSLPLKEVFRGAADLARETSATPSTGHLLLASFAAKNEAAKVLEDRGLGSSAAVDLLGEAGREHADLIEIVRERCRQVASSFRSSEVGVLHLLAVLSREPSSVAYKMLERGGIPPSKLRPALVSYITRGLPRHLRGEGREPRRPAEPVSGLYRRAPRGGGPGTDGRATRSTRDGSERVARDSAERRRRPGTRTTTETQPAEQPAAAPAAVEELVAEARPEVDEAPMAAPELEPVALPEAQPEDAEEPPPTPDIERFKLDPDRFPLLVMLGRNLSVEAARGELDALVCRDSEIHQIVDILNKRRANNPCLVGPPGVGKTAIVEGLARRIACEPGGVPGLGEKIIIALDAGSLLAGTSLRGSLSERLRDLKEEVASARGRVVIFFDEIHALLAPPSEGGGEAASELKVSLARGEFPCIGATTEEEYRKKVEPDAALARRFVEVAVAEPSPEEAREILEGLRPRYEAHHSVVYDPAAVDAAVKLSHRFLTGRFLPDKAIHLLDLAGARARRHGRELVDRGAVAAVAAAEIRVPVERLLLSDDERILRMEVEMSERIIGHADVVERLASVVRRNQAGFAGHRPIGSFLFLGPTGVGKTETAKVLADYLFATRDALCHLDMTEYAEAHAVARLIGAPPGYVGHDEGGQLTESIRRRSYQVVLLDEVEKAHPDVLKVLLQVLEEGRLTDGRGRSVDFSNTVVVITSNLGSERWSETRRSVGFGGGADGAQAEQGEAVAQQVIADGRTHFPPELWNRFDEKLVFRPLTREQVGQVAQLMIADSSKRLSRDRGISLEADESAVLHLIDQGGWSRDLGARPMRRTIERLIEDEMAKRILRGDLSEGDHVLVRAVPEAPNTRAALSFERVGSRVGSDLPT